MTMDASTTKAPKQTPSPAHLESKLGEGSHGDSSKKLILLGLPNAGKSTIFNLLTGGHRKVSNYSGITVDIASGDLSSNSSNEESYRVVDLPGIYNLNPSSIDEGLTLSFLLRAKKQYSYHKALIVLDWQRLTSSLGLALSILKHIGPNALIIINKDDDHEVTPERRRHLEEQLGVPVLPLSAIEGDFGPLDHFIRHSHEKVSLKDPSHKEGASNSKKPTIEESLLAKPVTMTTLASSYMDKDLQGPVHYKILPGSQGESLVAKEINSCLEQARTLLDEEKINENIERSNFSEKVDNVVLHPVLGGAIFLLTFYLLFSAIYTWAAPVMDFTEGLVLGLGEFIGSYLSEGLFKSLIVDGLFAGVGGVVIFLPQIMILFFLMSLLEQSGYISRAALIMDRFMSFFGLGGKAFLPYLSGYACAIPGIMAARTIPNPKERYATIMTLPLITCSARLPVYVLLVGTFVPSFKIAGFFDSQGVAFLFLYFLGSITALIMAKIFRLSYFKGEGSEFIIDLPPFQRPSLRAALYQSWLKGRAFLKKAGTIILGLSFIIWLLSTFPQTPADKLAGVDENHRAALQLENSALGRIGHAIEPAIQPLGMNWKIGVGLLVSFGARELFVSAMGTLYALGETDENSEGLKEQLIADRDRITGEPIFDLATAWSILMFFVFGLQCTSTVAILKKESGGWKVPLASFAYMFVLAYASSYIAYHLLS